MTITPPTVFISYSHDSEEHKERVRALSDRLCNEGIDCRIDRYPQNPKEGWPRWCENQIEECNFVLVVCTETYHSRYRGTEEAGIGKGVKFEGFIITQHFYNHDSLNEKFIPILFKPEDEQFIPTPLQGASRFLIDTDLNYELLCRLLTGQPDTPQPVIGPPRTLPPRPSTALSLTRVNRPHTLPYPSIGTLFTGREEFLQKLREKLLAKKTVGVHAVHGLGGVGKTRLAVEYGWHFLNEYAAVLFIGAESGAELVHNLAGLCGRLGLNLGNEPREEVKAEAALDWLANHANWLAIFDNADTAEAARAVEGILSRLGRGHVVITTRLANWSAAVTTLELDVLEKKDAIAFLLERTGEKRLARADDEAVAGELAEAVGCLALGLEQAGAFIKKHQCTLSAYLSRWREEDEKVRGWYDPQLMQYPRSVATTWETSFSQLKPQEQALLNTLAWLAPEPMPEILFKDTEGEAVTGLIAYSLARHERAAAGPNSAPSQYLRLHRLVQEVTRQRQTDDEGRQWLERALDLVNSATTGDPTDVRTWPLWDGLRPHVAAIVAHADRAGIAEPTTRLMNDLGVLLTTRCLHRQAEPLYRRALAIDEFSFGPDHPKVATDLNNLAQLLQATNRLHDAEPLMRRALAIDELSFGPDHPNVAIRLNNLASLLQNTNRLQDAEPLMRRALAIDELSFGPDHPKVARDLNNLAQLLQDTNRLHDAEPLMHRALAIDELSFGPHHPNVATDLNNLATLLKDTNRLHDAEPLMHRVVSILHHFGQTTGHRHPHMDLVSNNYRILLQAMNLTPSEISSRLAEFTLSPPPLPPSSPSS